MIHFSHTNILDVGSYVTAIKLEHTLYTEMASQQYPETNFDDSDNVNILNNIVNSNHQYQYFVIDENGRRQPISFVKYQQLKQQLQQQQQLQTQPQPQQQPQLQIQPQPQPQQRPQPAFIETEFTSQKQPMLSETQFIHRQPTVPARPVITEPTTELSMQPG